MSALTKANMVLREVIGCDYIAAELGRRYRSPLTRLIIRTRALCLAGRCRAAGTRSEVVAWICERAPLWVVVHVVLLLREPKV